MILFSLVTGRGEMASSCDREGLVWMSGKTSLQKKLLSTGIVVKHWNHPREVV